MWGLRPHTCFTFLLRNLGPQTPSRHMEILLIFRSALGDGQLQLQPLAEPGPRATPNPGKTRGPRWGQRRQISAGCYIGKAPKSALLPHLGGGPGAPNSAENLRFLILYTSPLPYRPFKEGPVGAYWSCSHIHSTPNLPRRVDVSRPVSARSRGFRCSRSGLIMRKPLDRPGPGRELQKKTKIGQT
jgi:hypothetical protein